MGTIHVADSFNPTDHNCLPFFEKQSNVLFIQTTIIVCSIGKIDRPTVGLSSLVIWRPSSQDFRRMQIDPSLECEAGSYMPVCFMNTDLSGDDTNLVPITILKSTSKWPLTDSNAGVDFSEHTLASCITVKAWQSRNIMSPDSVASMRNDTPLLSVDDLRNIAVAVIVAKRCRSFMPWSLTNCWK